LLQAISERFAKCRLQLHPEKTKLVYCKDNRRRGEYPYTSFDFLSFSFSARTVQDKNGNLFSGLSAYVSRSALKRMNRTLRQLRLHRRTSSTLEELAVDLNPILRGWINYYGRFYPDILKRFLARLDWRLGKWVRNKFRKFRGHRRRSWNWLKACRLSNPKLFAHWEYIYGNNS